MHSHKRRDALVTSQCDDTFSVSKHETHAKLHLSMYTHLRPETVGTTFGTFWVDLRGLNGAPDIGVPVRRVLRSHRSSKTVPAPPAADKHRPERYLSGTDPWASTCMSGAGGASNHPAVCAPTLDFLIIAVYRRPGLNYGSLD